MRTLKIAIWILSLLFVVHLPVVQAKTNYAYIANYQANNVSVINTSNNSVVTTISVGTNPWGVAVNQAGSAAYVTNANSNNVSVIATSTNTVAATIPVGTSPTGIAVAPNGK